MQWQPEEEKSHWAAIIESGAKVGQKFSATHW